MENGIPKYAQLEIERRMRIRNDMLPDLMQLPRKRIEDRYLTAGRMRLRKVTSEGAGTATSVYKLCKKYGPCVRYVEPIVNIYLTAEEYESLCTLPGNNLVKRRYSYDFHGSRFSIDEYLGVLAGLYLCECEASSEEILRDIRFPPFASEDVTDDPRYSGVMLAQGKTVET